MSQSTTNLEVIPVSKVPEGQPIISNPAACQHKQFGYIPGCTAIETIFSSRYRLASSLDSKILA